MTQSFAQLDLVEPIQRALRAENYETPTPIQAQAIPHLLAGKDLLGIAQTGTGKTAAFALPILQRLAAERPTPVRNAMRALILTPTRELAVQIHDSFRTYGRHLQLRSAVIYGGVGQKPQTDALARGPDIVVATPGRAACSTSCSRAMSASTASRSSSSTRPTACSTWASSTTSRE